MVNADAVVKFLHREHSTATLAVGLRSILRWLFIFFYFHHNLLFPVCALPCLRLQSYPVAFDFLVSFDELGQLRHCLLRLTSADIHRVLAANPICLDLEQHRVNIPTWYCCWRRICSNPTQRSVDVWIPIELADVVCEVFGLWEGQLHLGIAFSVSWPALPVDGIQTFVPHLALNFNYIEWLIYHFDFVSSRWLAAWWNRKQVVKWLLRVRQHIKILGSPLNWFDGKWAPKLVDHAVLLLLIGLEVFKWIFIHFKLF